MSDLPPIPPSGSPKEPLVKVGGFVGLIVAVFAVAVSFGLKISDDQQSALLGLAAILAPIVTVLWGRLKVWSPASVRAALQKALANRAASTPGRLPTTGGTEVVELP
jgi:hypothetical protein